MGVIKVKFKVYTIGKYTIVAKDADQAFGLYMEETNDLDDVYFGDLEEGESQEVTISIRRLTSKQITTKDMYCCDNGPCSFCKDSDDAVLVSFQDWIEKHVPDETYLPMIVAQEE
jgi:helix-turn-helix protein